MAGNNGEDIYNACGEASGGSVEDLREAISNRPKLINASSPVMSFKLTLYMAINPKHIN